MIEFAERNAKRIGATASGGSSMAKPLPPMQMRPALQIGAAQVTTRIRQLLAFKKKHNYNIIGLKHLQSIHRFTQSLHQSVS